MSTRPYVSFAEVKHVVTIPDVLQVLGIADRFTRKGETLVAVCPLPRLTPRPESNSEE